MQNDEGQIALKRLRQQQKRVNIPPDKSYLFVPKNGVCLAWIDPEDVEAVLNTYRRCCSTMVKQFYPASEMDVGIHRQ